MGETGRHRERRSAKRRPSVWKELFELLVRVLLLAAFGYVFFTRVFLLAQVGGMDMFPALKDGDLALAFRLQQTYAKGDVIAYQTPEGRRFGRIAAREGDMIDMDDSGAWQVNGTAQSGEILYPTYALEGIEYPFRVPTGCVFVLGDYRTKAADSRIYGAIGLDDVAGKVITILRRRGL